MSVPIETRKQEEIEAMTCNIRQGKRIRTEVFEAFQLIAPMPKDAPVLGADDFPRPKVYSLLAGRALKQDSRTRLICVSIMYLIYSYFMPHKESLYD